MKFQIFTPEVIHLLPQDAHSHSAVSPMSADADDACRAFVVCDGTPQSDAAGKAAETVCLALERFVQERADESLVFSDSDFDELLGAARTQLNAAFGKNTAGAATSVAILLLHRGGVLMAHLGDCRIYHVRPSKGALLYRSADDVPAAPGKAPKAMLPHDAAPADFTVVRSTDVRPGDRFLVCSRSVAAEMEESVLVDLLNDNYSNLAALSDRLGEQLDADRDEYAAHLVETAGMVLEPSDALQPDEEAAYLPITAAVPAAAAPEGAPAATSKTEPGAVPPTTRPAPKAKKKTVPAAPQHEGLRAVRNWVLSLAGIAIVIFAFWYVFGNDSGPESETIEMDIKPAAADTGSASSTPIDWLGTGSDKPAGNADIPTRENMPKHEEASGHKTEEEPGISADDLSGESSSSTADEPSAHTASPAPETAAPKHAGPENAAPAGANQSVGSAE